MCTLGATIHGPKPKLDATEIQITMSSTTITTTGFIIDGYNTPNSDCTFCCSESNDTSGHDLLEFLSGLLEFASSSGKSSECTRQSREEHTLYGKLLWWPGAVALSGRPIDPLRRYHKM